MRFGWQSKVHISKKKKKKEGEEKERGFLYANRVQVLQDSIYQLIEHIWWCIAIRMG